MSTQPGPDPAATEDTYGIRVVLVTVPDRTAGESIARVVVEERLAACGNLVPGLRSIYRWEGRIEESNEELLILKARASRIQALTRRVAELHPYDVPEVVAIPVSEGLPAYLEWVQREGAPDSP